MGANVSWQTVSLCSFISPFRAERDTVRGRPVDEAVVRLVLGDQERELRTAADGSFAIEKLQLGEWRAELAELNGQEPASAPHYNLVVPRSQCPACGHKIGALENIPLASYLVLRGRCSACGIRISLRYPLVEALTGILSGYVAWRFGFGWQTLAALCFVWAMLALAFIDLDTFYLPDDITLPLIWAGLLVNTGGMFVDLRCGASTGSISSQLEKKAWATVTSSFWPPSALGSAGRCCRS